MQEKMVCSGVVDVASRRGLGAYSFYGKASKRWLINLDNQFRSSMRTCGSKSFERNDGIQVLLQQDAFNLFPDTEWGRVLDGRGDAISAA